MLTQRRGRILRIIIDEYVETAAPVPSEMVARMRDLNVSPATVRNEMAGLEGEGFIERRHTSAGGIPSDKGYRHYVENLLDVPRLSPSEEQRMRHQFHQVEDSLEEWTRLAASIITEAVHNMGMATFPRGVDLRLKRLELVSLHEFVALLIIILHQATLRRQVIPLKEVHTQDDLENTGNKLNALFGGLSYSDIAAKNKGLTSFEAQVTDVAVKAMEEEANKAFEEPFVDGLRYLLNQPEFQERKRMQAFVDGFEAGKLFKALIPEGLGAEGLKVIIGSENRDGLMRDCSAVLTRYGVPGVLEGVVGAVGPTRLEYQRAIATVACVSAILSHLVGGLSNP